VISPRVSSTRGNLGPETLRRELASFDLPDAGRGNVVSYEPARDGTTEQGPEESRLIRQRAMGDEKD
jgi:hypothetical protein